MPNIALTPFWTELHLGHLSIDPERITVVAHAGRPSARCPCCSVPSHRIHSRCMRRLADLPWQGIPVAIELHTRRFFRVTLAGVQQIANGSSRPNGLVIRART